MLLAIDIGNTNIKLAICDGSRIVNLWRISTCVRRTIDEYLIIFRNLFCQSNVDYTQVNRVVISSVVLSINAVISETCNKYFNIIPFIIDEELVKNLDITIDFPNKVVGTDRLADVVAAFSLWPKKNLIIINMGTATTFNLLSQSGSYYGQIIVPGINSFATSLRSSTSLLPQAAVNQNSRLIGNSTVSALESGIFWGYAAMVEKMIEYIKIEQKKDFYVVATGGGSRLFSSKYMSFPSLTKPFIDEIDPHLTIKGLVALYRCSSM